MGAIRRKGLDVKTGGLYALSNRPADTGQRSPAMTTMQSPIAGHEDRYTERNVYGTTLRYPANGLSQFVCDALRSKTLTEHAQRLLTEYGATLVRELS